MIVLQCCRRSDLWGLEFLLSRDLALLSLHGRFHVELEQLYNDFFWDLPCRVSTKKLVVQFGAFQPIRACTFHLPDIFLSKTRWLNPVITCCC